LSTHNNAIDILASAGYYSLTKSVGRDFVAYAQGFAGSNQSGAVNNDGECLPINGAVHSNAFGQLALGIALGIAVINKPATSDCSTCYASCLPAWLFRMQSHNSKPPLGCRCGRCGRCRGCGRCRCGRRRNGADHIATDSDFHKLVWNELLAHNYAVNVIPLAGDNRLAQAVCGNLHTGVQRLACSYQTGSVNDNAKTLTIYGIIDSDALG